MNYLAHAWLSFYNPEILVGNMISDFVKGKKKCDYPRVVQQGIQLHRNIDTYTDEHLITKEAKVFFKPFVGLYAGAVMDVVYDHFLAKDLSQFACENDLLLFTNFVYETITSYKNILPQKFDNMFLYMKNDNWLYRYRTVTGIEKSFQGLVRRAKYLDDSNIIFKCFIINYAALENFYTMFFPALKIFAKAQLNLLQA